MKQYLLSTHAVEGEVSGAPGTPEEMQAFLERVAAVEEQLDADGRFVFGGALQPPDSATVVTVRDGGPVWTDGPFVESNAQIAGFYIINAEDRNEALAWAERVADATNHPIEVREFRATGRVEV